MLGLFEIVKESVWGVQSNDVPAPSDTERDKKPNQEQKTLTGRISHYNSSTGTGMIDRHVYFDVKTVLGQARPQVYPHVVVRVSFVIGGV